MGFAIGGLAALLATAWAAWSLLRYRAEPARRAEVVAVPAA